MNSELVASTASGLSVRSCDHYLDHLAGVSADHQLVIACGDVSNEFGVVLLRDRTPLGSHAAERMRGHWLLRPLDESLVLSRRLRAEDLPGCIVALVESEADLREVDRRLGGATLLRQLVAASTWTAPLLQKLTVLQLRMPRIFQRSLFSAWFTALLAAERALAIEECVLLLQASLFHDLGLLHIAPGLADKRSDIEPEEWLEIQRHAAHSAAIVAGSMEAPPRLLRIIREHHERSDGAGYPEGRLGEDIDPLARVIALADMLHTMRFQNTLLRYANLAECMPYLRVNRRTFDIDNYAPAGRILLAARSAGAAAAESAARSPSIQDLIDVNRSLATLLACFSEAQALLEDLGDGRVARSLRSLVGQVQWVTRASGLGDETLQQSLDASLREMRADAGIADMLDTAREVFWLVRRFERLLLEETRVRQGTTCAIALKDLALRVGSELTRAWRRFEH